MPEIMYCEDHTCACNCNGYCEYSFGIAIDKDRKCKAYIELKKEEEKKEVSSDDSND